MKWLTDLFKPATTTQTKQAARNKPSPPPPPPPPTDIQKLDHYDDDDQVRRMIKAGKAVKQADGNYKIKMPGGTYLYGKAYVERVLAG